MAALYQQNLQKALHLHEGGNFSVFFYLFFFFFCLGDLAGALKLTSATVAEMRKKGSCFAFQIY
jgi:hypothetical protein